MNAYVQPYILRPDPASRQWVWSYFAGFKRDFRFSKHVMGHVQLLYNIYDRYHKNPYSNRLNVRMGFDFPLQKK